jgi:hypothetical protein
MTEVLAAELYLRAGLPAARATPARVCFNGRELGPYVLKEGMDRTFLNRHFGEMGGNLYESCWGCDIDQPMERISGPGSDSQARRERWLPP